jgi:small subunit ribosomal protein S20
VANLASSKKRVKQSARSQERNKARKSRMKTETRKLLDAIHDGKTQAAKEQFQVVTKTLDQIGAKGTLHRNTVARKKSRLAKRLNAMAKAGKS